MNKVAGKIVSLAGLWEKIACKGFHFQGHKHRGIAFNSRGIVR